jgi:hypothetical protein
MIFDIIITAYIHTLAGFITETAQAPHLLYIMERIIKKMDPEF